MLLKFFNTFEGSKFKIQDLSMPSEEMLKSNGSHIGTGPYWGSYFQTNYLYKDLRKSFTPEQVVNLLGIEVNLIKDVITKSISPTDFETRIEEYEKKFNTTLEIGLNALTGALNLINCPTITACRGHLSAGYHGREAQPLICFFADKKTAKELEKLVKLAKKELGHDITISSVSARAMNGGHGNVVISSTNIIALVDFAGVIMLNLIPECKEIMGKISDIA